MKNIFRNGWMSVASIGAVTMTLLLVGVFLALILNLNQIAKNIEDDVEIKVLIDLSADDVDIQTLGTQIEKIPTVESVRFASNDEELKSLVDSMGEAGEAWLLLEQENPLNHVYIVHSEKPDDVGNIAETVESFNNVQEVNYGQDYVDRLDRKSTRLNSSHVAISYAVFCLKKKKCTRRRSTPVGWLRATRRGWGW